MVVMVVVVLCLFFFLLPFRCLAMAAGVLGLLTLSLGLSLFFIFCQVAATLMLGHLDDWRVGLTGAFFETVLFLSWLDFDFYRL